MANKVGRNEPCPCGSGEKYKHCHGSPQKEAEVGRKGQMVTMAIVGGLLVLGAGSFAYAMINYQTPTASAGLVWSDEHGHWHDSSGNKVEGPAGEGQIVPEPPGPAPEGKVWSAEHGHYHDAE